MLSNEKGTNLNPWPVQNLFWNSTLKKEQRLQNTKDTKHPNKIIVQRTHLDLQIIFISIHIQAQNISGLQPHCSLQNCFSTWETPWHYLADKPLRYEFSDPNLIYGKESYEKPQNNEIFLSIIAYPEKGLKLHISHLQGKAPTACTGCDAYFRR